jgi:hypothetical protein
LENCVGLEVCRVCIYALGGRLEGVQMNGG